MAAAPQSEGSLSFPGCTYKGLVHAAGQHVVIREEPCLNCSCRQGSLVCYLRVCRPLPNPPPPECVLIHRKRHCCPELICKGESPYHLYRYGSDQVDAHVINIFANYDFSQLKHFSSRYTDYRKCTYTYTYTYDVRV